jgi:hypothetical protein
MGLWLAASLPALILVLSFIRFSFVFGRLILSGQWPHFAGSAHAPVGLTNDGVVVRVGTPGLDSGLKLHMIDSPFVSFLLLWVCLTSYMPETRVNERWCCGWQRAFLP